MARMTSQHVDAVIHARFFLRYASDLFPDSSSKNVISRDIGLLHEVRNFLNDLIQSPPLPFGDSPNGDTNDKSGG